MSGAVDLSGFKDSPQPPAATPSGGPAAPAGGLAPIVEVTEANFEAEVLERSMQVPVVVELFAGSMPASAAFSATLDDLASAQGGSWVLAKVDLDVSPRIAQAFQVQVVPAVIAVAAGRPLADFDGGVEQLGQWVDAVLAATEGKLSGPPPVEGSESEPEPEDPRFVAAEDALAEGDLAGAEAGYQAILDAEPTNVQAQAAIRQVRFLARVQTVAPDAVATASAEPTNVEAQLDAADALLYTQQPEEAFGLLVEAIRRYAGDDRTAVRTRLLELFELFDPADAVVVAARRKLASALY
ncbi:tetratricopeptide repeat protein [Rhodococcus spelaei]|uniref:Tetratricopeptide repeat protein n=1 Tax=Rhodococcus spelaei TaxID=2546320 RepID=A0A541B4M9_9NOCA|nr:tetratricopeptide repeat protein [Rhodococcus spelaei]TQF67274.1 tetratricopeptide repeat protein [Rhodococcus spelaei]